MNSNFLNFFEQQLSSDNLAKYTQKFDISDNSILDLPKIEDYSQDFKNETSAFFEEFEESLTKKNMKKFLQNI